MREYWVHEDGSFGGWLTDQEITEKYEQLGKEALPQEGEDVVAWIMRTRGLSFVDAVVEVSFIALQEKERDHDA